MSRNVSGFQEPMTASKEIGTSILQHKELNSANLMRLEADSSPSDSSQESSLADNLILACGTPI